MQASDLAASAEDRSRFFWWLAAWFLNPPNAESLATLPTTIELAAPADPMDDAWLALARAAADLASASLDEVGSEYTRLFGGIQEGLAPPPPFESVWREDRLIGESTVAVITTYAEAGFADIDPDVGPQDHIVVELKFLALLALREAEAWQADDAAEARRRLTQQRAFIDQHIAAWVPRWADAVAEASQTPLYAALAGLLKAAIEQARAELAQMLAFGPVRQAMPVEQAGAPET